MSRNFVHACTVAFLMILVLASTGSAAFLEKNNAALQAQAALAKILSEKAAQPGKFVPPNIQQRTEAGQEIKGNYKDGEILVTFKTGVAENKKDNLHKKHGAHKIKEQKRLRLQHLKLKAGMSVNEAIKKYKADPDVEYAEPNMIVQIAATSPNDTYYSSSGSWGQSYRDMWGLDKIQAGNAWDITQGSGDVVVAVIDTGFDFNHADLQGKGWLNSREIVGNGIDDDGNGYIDDVKGWNFVNNSPNPQDDNGHGTHVSGTIAALTNNSQGIAGISWHSKIMPLKFLDASGSGSIDAAVDAIIYAADNGARVINNSWGGNGFSQALENAINYAFSKGVVVVAAAGNDYGNDAKFFSPANAENVITVGATDYQDNRAYFSNIGSTVEVAAPGVDILSLRAANTDLYRDGSHIVGTDYIRYSGTSMATPHVAGLAALLYAKNPTWTPGQIMSQIVGTTDNIGDPKIGTGRINAYTALNGQPTALHVTYFNHRFDDSAGNNDGIPDAGEDANLIVKIRNNGAPLSGATATLTSSDPYVTISSGTIDLGSVSSWTAREVSFAISISSQAPKLHNIPFTFTVTGTGGTTLISETINGRVTPYLPGWPVELQYGSGTNAILADLDRDGKPEVITTAKDIFVLKGDGTSLPGWPKVADELDYFSLPTAGDLDNDGIPEIVALSGNKIYAWKADGTILPGFPVYTAYNISHISLVDLDGDGYREILAYSGGWRTMYVYRRDGSNLPGWPVSLQFSYPLYTGNTNISTGDIDGDGKLEVIVPSDYENRVHAFHSDGTPVAGWPVTVLSPYSVTVADVNFDGKDEIFVGSSQALTYGFYGDGTPIPGWPHDGCAVSVGDINGDGLLEIATFLYGYGVAVYNTDGNLMPGWPQRTKINAWVAPSIADIDGDGIAEIVTRDGFSCLYAWKGNGTSVAEFPVCFGPDFYGGNESVPALGDINGDGLIDVVTGSGAFDSNIYAFNLPGAFNAGTAYWPMHQHDAEHSAKLPRSFVITNPSLAPAVVGTPYSQTLSATAGFATPYSWSIISGSLPTNLFLNEATGTITGTPSELGTWNFTVQVHDNQSHYHTRTLSITVSQMAITTISLPPGKVGQPFSYTFTAAGGSPPYTWSYLYGGLPPGISLDTNGVLSGTPYIEGNYYFTIRATSGELTADREFVWSIAASPIMVTPEPQVLPQAFRDSFYSQTLSATGGVPPYTWALNGSYKLPPGLTLSPTGTISGIPTETVNSYFFIQVSDNYGHIGYKFYELYVIESSLAITTSSLPNGSVNTAYIANLNAIGGMPPYTWSLVSGTLPAGLALKPSGELSGTPTAPGAYMFTIGVIDAQSAQRRVTFSIYIGEAAFRFWSTKASMPIGLSRGMSGVVDGKIYILGGLSDVGITDAVQKYDPDTNKWSLMLPLCGKRMAAGSAANGPFIYLAGGFDENWGYMNSVLAYNTYDGSCQQVGTLQDSRSRMSAAILNNKLYVVGGSGVTSTLNSIEEFDLDAPFPHTSVMKTRTLPEPRSLAGVVSDGQKLFILGGNAQNGPTKSCFTYDPTTDSLSPIADMPLAVEARSALYSSGKIYVVSGFATAEAGNTVQEYTPSTDTWQVVTSAPTPRDVPMAEMVNGILYVLGGRNYTGSPTLQNVNEAWGTLASTWTINSVGPPSGPPFNVIDWPAEQHPLLSQGNYVLINNVFYFVIGSGTPTWNGPNYVAAALQQCDQINGTPLTDPNNPGSPLYPNLAGTEGSPILLFSQWPGNALDPVPPVTTIALSGTSGLNDWYVSDVQVTLSATDNPGGSGVTRTEYSFDNINWTTYTGPFQITTDGTTSLYYRSVDNLGNVERPAKQQTIKIDRIAPQSDAVTSGIIGPNGWYRSNVLVTLVASDNSGGSGIASIEYSFDNVTWTPYLSPLTFSTEGITSLYYRSKDFAGNSELSSRQLVVQIDKTAPLTQASLTGTMGQNGWYTSDVQVTLTAQDNGGSSSIARTEYSLDHTSWITYSAPFSITTSGNLTLYYRSVDSAGNMEQPDNEQAVKIDRIAPQVNATLNGTLGENGLYSSDVLVTLTATDNQNGSGVTITEYSFDNTVWNIYSSPLLISTQGATQLYYRVTDTAGNTVTTKYDLILIDKIGVSKWSAIGPFGASVKGIVASPNYSADHTLFAATQVGGMFKSTDGGVTWASLNVGLPAKYLYTVVISPNFAQDNTVFTSVRGYGIFKSTNAGASWSAINNGIAAITYIYSLTVSPNYAADQTLFAGTYSAGTGVFKSTDGGLTWTPAYSIANGRRVQSLACSPQYAADKTVYAGIYGGYIVKSVDGGTNWSTVNNGITDSNIYGVTLSSNYAVDQTAFARGGGGALFRTLDGGASWTQILTGIFSDVVFSPIYQSDRTVFAGNNKSVDGGTTWSTTVSSSVLSMAVSPDFASDRTVFTAAYAGLFRSTDGGVVWPIVGKGVTNADVLAIAESPNFATDRTVFVATTSGVFKSTDGGLSWTDVNTGISGYTQVTSLAISPNFTNDQTVFVGTKNSGAFKTTNGGASWAISSGLSSNEIRGLAISPNYTNDQTIFAITIYIPSTPQTARVYKSTNGGSSWTQKLSYSSAEGYSVAVSPNFATDKTLFIGTNYGVSKSINAGDNWAVSSSGAAYSLAISSNYATDLTVFAGTAIGGIKRSTDGGTTWTVVNSGIPIVPATGYPVAINALSITPNYPTSQTIFAGTASNGVFISSDGGLSWSPLGLGLERFPTIKSLTASPNYAADQTIYAGTTIGGTWSYTIGPRITITSPVDGSILSGSSFTISGTASSQTGSPAVHVVEVSTDGGTTWNQATGTTSWSYSWSAVADGKYTIKCRAKDTLGISGAQAVSKVTVDNAAPVSTITNPANNAYLGGSSFTISGTASDSGAGVQKVEVSTDGGTTWNQATGTGTWSYYWPLPADGSYTIKSKATDKAGRVEVPAAGTTVVVDNTPPALMITAPAANALLSGTVATISGTASDGSGSGVNRVEISFNGGTTWTAATGTTSWSFNWPLPADGPYTIKCRVIDNAGMSTVSDVSVTVDNTPPTTSIGVSGTQGMNDWYTSDVQVALTATDSGTGLARTEYSLDGSTWNTYSAPFTVTAEKINTISYRSVDQAGVIEAINTKQVKIDKIGPVYDERVSVSTSGAQANSMNFDQIISDDGRFVLFGTHASNLVPGSPGGYIEDVMLRDRQTGTTERISSLGTGQSYNRPGGITPDGRFVTFHSFYAVKLLDRQTGTTETISVSSSGVPATFGSMNWGGAMSSNGRYVAFSSEADNLVPGHSGWYKDVFVRDRQTGTTEQISVSSSGIAGNAASYDPYISADGRYVYFTSEASNLVPGDTNGVADVFIRDRQAGTTVRVSLSSGGVQGNGKSVATSASTDGRYVVFQSDASNLVAGDTNSVSDIFVHDLQTGETTRISISSTGQQGLMASDSATISPDGRFIGFMSQANLVTDNPLYFPYFSYDSYVHDRLTGTTELFYRKTSDAYAKNPAFSRNGTFAVYQSNDDTLVSGDTNGSNTPDIFVRDNTAVAIDGTVGTNGWYTSDVNVTLFPAKDPVSGVARTEYSTDGSNWSTYSGPFTLSAEVATTLQSRSVDVAGLVGKSTTTVIKIDKLPPVTTATMAGTLGNNGWYASSVVVTLAATDNGGSGVSRTEYSINGSGWTTYASPFTISAEGTSTVSYRSVDRTGLIETPSSQSVKIDKVKPVAIIASPTNGAWITGTTFTVSGTASDASGSGIQKVEISSDNGVTWNLASGTANWTYAWTLPADASYTIRSRATDNAGNIETPAPGITVTIDNTPPTVSLISPVAGLTNNRTPQLVYTVSDGTVVVTVDGTVVSKVSGDTLGPLADGPHTIRVEATDTAGNHGFAERNFTVDATPPTVSITAPVSGTTADSTPLLTFSVSDGTVVVKVDGTTVSKVSGNSLDLLANGQHTVTVTATDPAGNVGSAQVTFTVAATPLSITTTSLPWDTTGISYNQTLTATGGIPPYTWSIASGSLPAGLTLSASGTITGTPSTVGSSTFTVQVRDADGTVVTKTFTIDIFAPLTIPSQTLPNGTTGSSYSYTMTATGGKTPYTTWTLASGSLPTGLTFSASGAITGTPTTTGTSTFTVRVTDANGSTATSSSLSITISTAPLVITTTSPLPDAYKTVVYNVTLVASGGKAPYTWTKTAGTIPTGLSLSSAGVISGTPTGSTGTFTVQVKDANNTTVTKNLTINVYTLPTISTASLAAGNVGSAYSQTLAATNGKTPYTWSISTGSLPGGLSLNASTGVISGTPTASGTFSFTAMVTDANGKAATKSLSIVINAALPDLIVTSVSGPATGTRGKTITVTATVKNQGLGSAASSALTFYLSSDASITTTDTSLGTSTINTLAAGGSQTVSATFTIKSNQSTGTYYIGAIADQPAKVSESVETNNSLAGNTIVVN